MDKDEIVNSILEGVAAHLESRAKEYGNGYGELEPDVVCEVLMQEAQTIRESHSKYEEVRVLEASEEQFTLTNSELAGTKDRRFKVLPMTPELLFSMVFNCLAGRDKECFTQISALIIEGLPSDVRIEGIAYEPRHNFLLLRLWSSIWPVIGASDIPVLKWDQDIKIISKRMLLQPYTSCDLLEMMNEARSKMGLDHLSFNWSERPIWLRDVLLLEGDVAKDGGGVQLNMPVPGAGPITGEVYAKEDGNG